MTNQDNPQQEGHNSEPQTGRETGTGPRDPNVKKR